ncbi:MAG: TolC family protein [Candidatus Hydrogenedentes bacterium]|nr:TolC family protein [Candidatus Hydrogenedentota bacterium]
MAVLVLGVAAVAEDAAEPVDRGILDELANVSEVIDGAESFENPADAVPGGEALTLTIEKCAALAIERNAQAYIAETKIAAAKAKIGQASSARLPQLSAKAAYSYVDGIQTDLNMGGAAGLLVNTKGMMPSKDTRTIQFDVTQVLYAGGQIAAAIRAAESLAQSEEWQKDVALDTLEFQAKQAFYDCLLSRALVRVAERSMTTFKRHLSDAQEAFDVGLIGNFEVLRAKTELGAREADHTSAENAARLAMVNLRRLLAVSQDTAITFEGKLDWVPLETPSETLVAEALANRAELRALDAAKTAAQENLTRIKGQYKPKVAAQAQWSKIDGTGQFFPDGFQVSVGANYDIYAGGRRKNEVAEAEAQIDNLKYQVDDVQRLIEMDVQQSVIQVQNAIATIRREKGTVELGTEGQRLAELRFQEGVGTQVETLDADLALTTAETALVRALRDYAVANAALHKALGRSTTARRGESETEAPCEK